MCLCLSACALDNYQAPDSQFFGKVIDEVTNEPIQQDLIAGSAVEFIELKYEYPSIRGIRFQTDGTFRENNIFAGEYEVQALRGNFFVTEKDTIEIKGATEYTFRTLPYIRIKDVELSFDEIKGEVTAEFTLDQIAEDPVEEICLIADRNPNLSYYLQRIMVSKKVNADVQQDQKFKLTLSTERMDSGKDYYFRVAAKIANIPQAKHNYSVPVKMNIDNSNVVPEVIIEGKVLDNCDSFDGWSSWFGGATYLETDEMKEGTGCIRTDCHDGGGNPYGAWIFEKEFAPFDTEVSREKGYIAFYMYVSDAAGLTSSNGNEFFIRCANGTTIDWSQEELALVSGWNKVELSLSKAPASFDLSAVVHVDVLNYAIRGPLVIMIDYIRFYEKD